MEFRLDQWRSCCTQDIRVPSDACMRAAIDLSMTASDHSDRSSIAIGFFDDELQLPEGKRVTLMDLRTDYWPGLSLPQQIVTAIQDWKVQHLDVERIPGSDLVLDSVKMLCEQQGVVLPSINAFIRNSRRDAKPRRIWCLQELLNTGRLRIRYSTFINTLFEEAEQSGTRR